MYVILPSYIQVLTNFRLLQSMSSGGVICKGRSPINQIGLALEHLMRGATSLVYTFGELAVQESLLSSITVPSTLANGSPHRKYLVNSTLQD
jgi:hypothetical protein